MCGLWPAPEYVWRLACGSAVATLSRTAPKNGGVADQFIEELQSVHLIDCHERTPLLLFATGYRQIVVRVSARTASGSERPNSNTDGVQNWNTTGSRREPKL